MKNFKKNQNKKDQLFSSIYNFIEVKNNSNKVIPKGDIGEIKIYREYDVIVIDNISLAVNRPVAMES